MPAKKSIYIFTLSTLVELLIFGAKFKKIQKNRKNAKFARKFCIFWCEFLKLHKNI